MSKHSLNLAILLSNRIIANYCSDAGKLTNNIQPTKSFTHMERKVVRVIVGCSKPPLNV